MVETAKRIFTKEKINRQLAGQSSSTPFMSTKDSYNNKVVTFNTQGGLEEKIDRLRFMMSKLAANDEQTNSLNQKYIKAKGDSKWEISMTDLTVKIDIDQILR